VTWPRSAAPYPCSARLKARLLEHGCLFVLKDPHHVARVFTALTRLEVFAARVAWRQQEHHPVPQEAHARPLLLAEVVDVLFKLALLRIVLGYEGDHALHRVLVHVLKVGAVRHIQIVVLVAQVAHDIRLLELPNHICFHEDAVGLVPSHEAGPNIAVVILKDVFASGPLLLLVRGANEANFRRRLFIYSLILLLLLIFFPEKLDDRTRLRFLLTRGWYLLGCRLNLLGWLLRCLALRGSHALQLSLLHQVLDDLVHFGGVRILLDLAQQFVGDRMVVLHHALEDRHRHQLLHDWVAELGSCAWRWLRLLGHLFVQLQLGSLARVEAHCWRDRRIVLKLGLGEGRPCMLQLVVLQVLVGIWVIEIFVSFSYR